MKLGRPRGQANILKLDNYRDEILKYLKKSINKRAISKLIECSASTLYEWLSRRKISCN
jgi:transposase